MSNPALLMWAIVMGIGVPSALRNPTAAALVLAKIAGWGWYQITGDNLPVQFYALPDIFCLAVIMAKQEWCNQQPYRGTIHQLQCFLLERSPADRAVMLTFLAMWAVYVAPIHDYYRWWLLYGGVILQFLFASAESLEIFWRQRAMLRSVSPIIDRHLVVIPFPTKHRAAERALLTHATGGGGYG